MVFIPFLLAQIKIGGFEDEVKNNIHECVEQREKEKRKIPGGGEGEWKEECHHFAMASCQELFLCSLLFF